VGSLPVRRRPLSVKLVATLWLVICVLHRARVLLHPLRVLDVDGSIFPTPPTTTTPIKLAGRAEIKRRPASPVRRQLWDALSSSPGARGHGLRQISAHAHAPAQPGPRPAWPRLRLPRASLETLRSVRLIASAAFTDQSRRIEETFMFRIVIAVCCLALFRRRAASMRRSACPRSPWSRRCGWRARPPQRAAPGVRGSRRGRRRDHAGSGQSDRQLPR